MVSLIGRCFISMQLLTFDDRDQELRFTVHDSPDYYQLKVSVFNDDKKTDLIGETWIPLEMVVVPGGGQNDLWHNLQCKGRYAGEIRIELTYYDTRPREEKPVDKRRESARNGPDDSGREGVPGPRQPKPVKRRPLPADPTDSSPLRPILPDHSLSSPLPFIPPQGQQPRLYAQTTPASHLRYSQSGLTRSSPMDGTGSYHGPQQGTIAMTPAPQQLESSHYEIYDPIGDSGYIPGNVLGRYDSFEDEEEAEIQPPLQAPTNDYRNAPPPALHSHNSHTSLQKQSRHRIVPYGLPHSSSAPLMAQHHSKSEVPRRRVNQPYDQGHHGSSPLNSTSYQEKSIDCDFFDPVYDHHPRSMQPSVEDDEPPPPPPAHRSSGSQLSLYEPQTPTGYHHVSAPAPLNIRSGRNSASPNPYSVQGTNSYHPQDEFGFSASPSSGRGLSHPGAAAGPQAHYTQPQRRQSQDPTLASPHGDGSYVMPPSLVPGYNPRMVEDESPSMIHEKRMSSRIGNGAGPASTHRQSPSHENQPRAHPLSRQDFATSSPSAAVDGSQAHRSSAPMIKPRAVSPDPRTPIRKSVSPQPGPRPEERRLSAIPFSPDSYETLNPNFASASSLDKPGAQYHTPEQAKEAFRQSQREAQRDEGPIIGNDGRVIDPSDHLPTDTWAPEPERKNAKKDPEPVTRSRPSLQGAQPMPLAGRRPLRDGAARPKSISTPIYAHSPDAVSPSSATRNRLQKKSRVSPAQPTSSPAVPMINTMPRSFPRTSTSEYPLREHENYGYGSSPTYARSSPTGPPPVPAKVPIAAGQEDYGMSALSEEMKRIDIGVGVGAGRARRNRY